MSSTPTELRQLFIDHTADASNADVKHANQDMSRFPLA
jgi:hypothetical protein